MTLGLEEIDESVLVTTVKFSILREQPNVLVAVKDATRVDIAFTSIKRLSATRTSQWLILLHSFGHKEGQG
jgi:hypothetical protein